jgi:uncharacterized membrane protein YphA (DoxX/SURF4 family)
VVEVGGGRALLVRFQTRAVEVVLAVFTVATAITFGDFTSAKINF